MNKIKKKIDKLFNICSKNSFNVLTNSQKQMLNHKEIKIDLIQLVNVYMN